jgi:DNA-binding NarL/FixJ family response regulator
MSIAVHERGAKQDAAPRTISLLLADDHPLMLAGIRRAVDHAEDVDVIGEAQSGPQLLALIERRRPDVVLMDMRMPGVDGPECIAQIRENWPEVKVVVLSAAEEPRLIDAALRAGASAYVVKSAAPSDVAAVLRQVVSGAVFVAPAGAPAQRPPSEPARPTLTEREEAVLGAVAAGLTTTQISRELWISEHTIKFHLTNIYRKLGVPNRAAAVRYAIESGIGSSFQPGRSNVA